MRIFHIPCVFVVLCLAITASAQSSRTFSGVVVSPQFELVPGVTIEIRAASGNITIVSDERGRFTADVPSGPFTAALSGSNIAPVTRNFAANDVTTDLQLRITFVVPAVSESVTIVGSSLTPTVEFRNDTIYKNNLFGRDDQLIQTLNAGINVGQHEGGGKSLEVRRFGFNLDHGGVNGGLKILVDNIQQNQGTQGHGQGYLGSLKSLSPELVEDVSIINGPFSAAYGDFSGLGVVHIQLKESLPQIITARVQGGSFNSIRGFFAFSPSWKNIDSFIAYEPSYTDGPFKNPLKYRRDNLTANLTYKFDDRRALGLRMNFGRNDFTSSGQIPLDLVADGSLDRFGFIDPSEGGKVRQGTGAVYFRNEWGSGSIFKADAFVNRSLFDLYSDFTFFAVDPVYGDQIQQHDSRLQEGGNVQFVSPYSVLGHPAVLTAGANILTSQINVGLYPTVDRSPSRKYLPGNIDNPDILLTSAHANVNNFGGYIQNEFNFFNSRLRIDAGLRYDLFTFDVNGYELTDVRTDVIGKQSSGKLQPKLSVAYSPSDRLPVSLYLNYGRGISSQDARGVVRDPDSPKVSTTDFYQAGASYNGDRISGVVSVFLIDRSNEQVYIPDDGSIELAGPSRSYGIEARTSVRIASFLSFNGGFTNVIKAFYKGERALDGSRLIVDSAPHLVANAGLVLSNFKGFNSSLSWRHISNYRLDGDDPGIRASGHDVVDLALTRRITSWMDANLAVDNLFNKRYYETQNYFESRTCPTCGLITRIHATPGYPTTITAGVTFRIWPKK